MEAIGYGYGKELSDDKFWTKVRRYAKKIGREVVHKAICLWLVIKEPGVPLWAKTVAAAALGYLILPLDVVPDPLPGGLVDDASTVAAAFVTVSMYITPEIERKANDLMPVWLRN